MTERGAQDDGGGHLASNVCNSRRTCDTLVDHGTNGKQLRITKGIHRTRRSTGGSECNR